MTSAPPIVLLLQLLIRTHLLSFGAKKQVSIPKEKARERNKISIPEELQSKMRIHDKGEVLGFPVTSVSLWEENASIDQSARKNVVNNWMRRVRMKTGAYIQGIRQRVRSAPKKSENVNENLSLSSRIMQRGVDRVFEQLFYIEEGENLLKASKCYLSTTAGPIAGIVFISTEKVAFHSDKLIKFNSPNGQLIRVPYKVLIPQRKIKTVVSSESTNKPSQKYIQIVTTDDFEFWFMGFKYLKHALSEL